MAGKKSGSNPNKTGFFKKGSAKGSPDYRKAKPATRTLMNTSRQRTGSPAKVVSAGKTRTRIGTAASGTKNIRKKGY